MSEALPLQDLTAIWTSPLVVVAMTSVVVQDFLRAAAGGGNFARSAPRPPVPGEETDRSCASSTRSAGSHQSHVSAATQSQSGRSCSDVGSHQSSKKTSGKSSSVSPCATPRKSTLDKTSSTASVDGSTLKPASDAAAPLGFEPEGSADGSPGFVETGTPAYLRWAESLKYLLEDGEGVKLFRQFLVDQEHGAANALDFWFACSGLKLVSGSDRVTVTSLVRLIYKKYVKGDRLRLRPEAKRQIVDRLRRDDVDQAIFDAAQAEVEGAIRNETYPLFLKSDTYLHYVQLGGESPKASHNSSGSDRVSHSLILPTVHEERELQSADIGDTSRLLPVLQDSYVTPSLTECLLLSTRKERQNCVYFRDIERSVFSSSEPLFKFVRNLLLFER